jgi:hypothetical protein
MSVQKQVGELYQQPKPANGCERRHQRKEIHAKPAAEILLVKSHARGSPAHLRIQSRIGTGNKGMRLGRKAASADREPSGSAGTARRGGSSLRPLRTERPLAVRNDPLDRRHGLGDHPDQTHFVPAIAGLA